MYAMFIRPSIPNTFNVNELLEMRRYTKSERPHYHQRFKTRTLITNNG